MNKILTSVWFAVAVGLLGFIGTVGALFLLDPPKPAETEAQQSAETTNAPPDETTAQSDLHQIEGIDAAPVIPPAEPVPASLLAQVSEPGSLSFNNPEVTDLVEELRRERELLRQKEEQLLQLRRQIILEKAEIGSITQDFLRAKALMEEAMTNRVTLLQNLETNKLALLAKVYTNMPPSAAVAILDKMSVEDVARILEFMKEGNKAAILENFATNDFYKASGKATEISDRLRRIAPPPNLPDTPRITEAKPSAE